MAYSSARKSYDICVVGSGNWGTTLAIVQAQASRRVVLCVREAARARSLEDSRENTESLPGVPFPSDLVVEAGYEAARSASFVIIAVPSEHIRSTCSALFPHLREDSIIVSATKGLAVGTGLRVSQVINAELGDRAGLCVLSGPNLAREIAAGMPAAAVLASSNHAVAVDAAAAIGTRLFRLYTSDDVIGVELGGALKNVVALAAGMCDGLGMGMNGKAAIVTRGMAEIVRLGRACGADPLTFAGLSGYGDLFATCVSPLSRNHHVGEQLGSGKALPDILATMTMVAEGVNTALAAQELAKQYSVELPITDQICAVLFRGKNPRAAMEDLLSRSAGDEQTGQPL